MARLASRVRWERLLSLIATAESEESPLSGKSILILEVNLKRSDAFLIVAAFID
jgi:hypothetical protein